jgi:hypothetical protein
VRARGQRARLPRRLGRQAQRGYVLILVLTSLVVVGLVAATFATRVDHLRRHVQSLQDFANARLKATDAFEVALYHATTRPGGPRGFGLGAELVVADGRPYALPSGALVAVTDQRALLSLHNNDPIPLRRLVQGLGASPAEADALVDILLDYADTDSLKRLNGAEAPGYAQLGLIGPRNDWLVSTRELGRMPLWRERPQWVQLMGTLTSPRVSGYLNPSLAPMAVVRAILPGATPEQLDLFDRLRRSGESFVSAAQVREATGLILTGDEFLFHTSYEQAYTAWAPGMPTSLHVQVMMTPESPLAPWQVVAVHTAPAPGNPPAGSGWPRFPLSLAHGSP